MTSIRTPMALGFAGLLPQALAVGAIYFDRSEYHFLALGMAYFYAATILAFIGGIWWGIAAGRPDAPSWLYGVAVVPQLVAFASAIPWSLGWAWPGPSLQIIAFMLVLTLFVDNHLAKVRLVPSWWMALRTPLSVGLAAMCMIVSVATL